MDTRNNYNLMDGIKRLDISLHVIPDPSLEENQVWATPGRPHPPLSVRLITFNIRYAAPAGARFPHEKPWSMRGPLLVERLQQVIADAPAGAVVLLGLQEVLDAQLEDIKRGLGDGWAYVGVGRDDGDRAGEYNPVLYRPAQVRLLQHQTRWLSPTPETPSFGWNAGSRRVITAAVLEHAATGRRFVAANTHLDNASSTARSEGVGVVLASIRRLRRRWGPLPATLTGDFNSSPGEDAYAAMQASGFAQDLCKAADPARHVGPHRETYTGFEVDDVHTRIDFAWIAPPDGVDKTDETHWAVDRYEVLSNVHGGIHISDHRPVMGDLTLVG